MCAIDPTYVLMILLKEMMEGEKTPGVTLV